MYTPATSVYNTTTTELPLVGFFDHPSNAENEQVHSFSTEIGPLPAPPPNHELVCSFLMALGHCLDGTVG